MAPFEYGTFMMCSDCTNTSQKLHMYIYCGVFVADEAIKYARPFYNYKNISNQATISWMIVTENASSLISYS